MMTYLSSQKFILFSFHNASMLLCQYGIVMFISQTIFSRQFYRYFKKRGRKNEIFALINIILMNGIDSKLHFHIFHSFRSISAMALCQITYVFIFPFTTFSLLFRFIWIFFFIALFAFGSLYSYPHST